MRGRLAVAAALTLAIVLPDAAMACAVCSPGDEESRSAFIWTTVLLSVLPPGMVGGVVWWLWRQHRRREESRRDAPQGVQAAPEISTP